MNTKKIKKTAKSIAVYPINSMLVTGAVTYAMVVRPAAKAYVNLVHKTAEIKAYGFESEAV